MAREDQVQPGQKYRQVSTSTPGHLTAITWEVDRMVTATDGLAYVRLVRVDDRGRQKTISLSTLLDRHYFQRA